MSQYLIFQLHGPMASWGVDAPGEVRHTHELPSRSALLGLLAAGTEPYVLKVTQAEFDKWEAVWACCPTGVGRRIQGVPLLIK